MPSVDTFYRAKRAAASGNVTAETTIKTADNVANPALTYLPASGKLSGQGVRVVVRGEIVAGASGNVTIALRVGNTVAGTLLATTGAIASGGAGNFNFELVFEGVWDSQSDSLRGRMFGHSMATAVAEAINSTVITGYDPDLAVDMPVVATALFSVSNAANDVRVKELVTETV